MRTRSEIPLLLGLAALLAAEGAAAATLGVLSDFETGQQGWFSGPQNLNPPVVAADGGPQGAGDAFLRVTANGGVGMGGRLVFFNRMGAWTGSYTSAGIAAIEMDLKNLTEAVLSIRIEIQGPSMNRIVSTAAAQLAALQDWTHFRIPIDAAGFAGANVAAALANAVEIRILHNPQATPSISAPFIAAQLGIDNVRTAPVPEPSTIALVAAGLAGLGAGHRSRAERAASQGRQAAAQRAGAPVELGPGERSRTARL